MMPKSSPQRFWWNQFGMWSEHWDVFRGSLGGSNMQPMLRTTSLPSTLIHAQSFKPEFPECVLSHTCMSFCQGTRSAWNTVPILLSLGCHLLTHVKTQWRYSFPGGTLLACFLCILCYKQCLLIVLPPPIGCELFDSKHCDVFILVAQTDNV